MTKPYSDKSKSLNFSNSAGSLPVTKLISISSFEKTSCISFGPRYEPPIPKIIIFLKLVLINFVKTSISSKFFEYKSDSGSLYLKCVTALFSVLFSLTPDLRS